MTLEELIAQAQQFEKDENFQKAFDLFTEAIRLSPTSPDLFSWRGVVLFHLDKKEDALADMNKAVELQPDYSYRYSSRAYIKASLMLIDEAIADYKKCIELDPQDSIAYNNLGMMEEQKGWNQMAKKNFEKADELEGLLKANKIESGKEQRKNKGTIDNSQKKDSKLSKGRIFRDVFTKKETFKEFLHFIKSGFKIKD